MRIIRFIDEEGRERWGMPNDDGTAAAVITDVHGLLSPQQKLPARSSIGKTLQSGEAFVVASDAAQVVNVLAPVMPVNILCAGQNYRAAAREDEGGSGDSPPLELFMKPTTALQRPGGPIVLPRDEGGEPDVDAEGELAVLIGTKLRDVSERQALDAIVGCTIAMDVTDRRWQTPTGPPLWMRGKGFDTFCPIGPELVTVDELSDQLQSAAGLAIRTRVNGEVVREGTTGWMIRSVGLLIAEISRFMTILPGTLVLTGAPPLVSVVGKRHRGLRAGDVVEAEVEGIGRMVASCE